MCGRLHSWGVGRANRLARHASVAARLAPSAVARAGGGYKTRTGRGGGGLRPYIALLPIMKKILLSNDAVSFTLRCTQPAVDLRPAGPRARSLTVDLAPDLDFGPDLAPRRRARPASPRCAPSRPSALARAGWLEHSVCAGRVQAGTARAPCRSRPWEGAARARGWRRGWGRR